MTHSARWTATFPTAAPLRPFEPCPPRVLCALPLLYVLAAARELASASGRPFDVQLAQESEKSAFFAARSTITTV
ncbi:hypothetical protein EON68_04215 [archaeon]|nr:MAG: hypothetical protein EON68_04215 [archaeon]